MARWIRFAAVLAVLAIAFSWWSAHQGGAPGIAGPPAAAPAAAYPAFLPAEAVATIESIKRGGPFPYGRDGVVFQNREGQLPERPRGYYHEYTVETPGARDRGARRIVTGGTPPEVFYYSDDHYRTFRRLEIPR